jgi:hypothetical protein
LELVFKRINKINVGKMWGKKKAKPFIYNGLAYNKKVPTTGFEPAHH